MYATTIDIELGHKQVVVLLDEQICEHGLSDDMIKEIKKSIHKNPGSITKISQRLYNKIQEDLYIGRGDVELLLGTTQKGNFSMQTQKQLKQIKLWLIKVKKCEKEIENNLNKYIKIFECVTWFN